MIPDHEALLTASAIDPVEAVRLGVREATEIDDLPEFARRYGDDVLPALVFPWRSVDGKVVEQVRSALPLVAKDGRQLKYLWPSGVAPVLNVPVRVEKPARVVIVEGTRQTLAALRYAPSDWQVVGIGGCSSWTVDGVGNADLMTLVDGLPVTIIFDADVDRNVEVWTAAKKLGEACDLYGAESVSWATLPGRGTTGLDDVLGQLKDDQRAKMLASIVDKASGKLPSKPKNKQSADKIDWEALGKHDRPVILADDDRARVTNSVVEVIRNKMDGTTLFSRDGEIAKYEGGKLTDVDNKTLTSVAHTLTKPVAQRETSTGLVIVDAEYSATTMKMIEVACGNSLTSLRGLTKTPFVREDGTVCTTPGYDDQTNMILAPTPGLETVRVPETPTRSDVAAAVELIAAAWLGDFPFEDQTARANAIGYILTPIIRHLVTLVPMALFDGRGAGVGKGLLHDVVHLMTLGTVPDPVTLSSNRDEAWKEIHSYARSGQTSITLDESPVIKGEALAMAITAPSINRRILGVSESASYPNLFTWAAMGNGISVRGDMFRRVYPIRIYPSKEGWENRKPAEFRHPDLRRWTANNRGALLGAALTVVRNWYAQGRPDPSEQTFGFGSFEQWQHLTAGVLEAAGVEGFLAGMMDWRDSAARDTEDWVDHLTGLREKFGDKAFTVDTARSHVASEWLVDPLMHEEGSPDPLKDAKAYNWALGGLYRKYQDREFKGLRLRNAGKEGHSKRGLWAVDARNAEVAEVAESVSKRAYGETLGNPAHNARTYVAARSASATSATSANRRLVLGADFETAGLDLPREGDASGFIRLLGIHDGTEGVTTTDLDDMCEVLTSGATLVFANGNKFDVPAALHALGIDISANSVDCLALFRAKNPKSNAFTLDDIAYEVLGERKLDSDVLVDEFGGWDKIPVDDPRYREYCLRDAELALRVYQALGDDYAPTQAVADRVTARLNSCGVKIDVATAEAQAESAAAESVEHYEAFVSLGLPGEGNPWSTKEAQAFVATHEPEWPRTKATEAHPFGQYTFAQEVVDQVEPTSDKMVEFLAAKAGVLESRNGFAKQLLKHRQGDRVYPTWHDSTRNGRWSASKPNVLGAGKRTERLIQQRRAVVADEGLVFVGADLSAIDNRAVAGLSGDQAYLDALMPGRNIHTEVAAALGICRNEAKIINHGTNYGMQAPSLSRKLKVEESEAQQMLDDLAKKYPDVHEWKTKVIALGSSGLPLDNGFGRKLLVSRKNAATQAAAYSAASCAKDLMVTSLSRDPELIDRLALVVHDECLLAVPSDEADEWRDRLVAALTWTWSSPSGLEVPIIAEAHPNAASRWSDVYGSEG